MQAVICHYDLLIDENNDPVLDPPELQAYMDLWDGKAFLQALMLDGTKSALEIGVGTGRLAMRAAALCRCLTGIDVSPKTIARARENLAPFNNITLMCGDFLMTEFAESFDVIYSSLTFMHIAQKKAAIERIASILLPGGRVVISLDKNQADMLDYGTRTIRVYPDQPEVVEGYMKACGLTVLPRLETQAAYIVAAKKS